MDETQDRPILSPEQAALLGQQYNQTYGDQLDPSLARYALDSLKELNRIEHHLRGEVSEALSDGSLRWVTRYKPIMVEQGIYELMRYLYGFVSKNTLLSNLSEEQARRDVIVNANGLAKFLFINRRRFELGIEKYEELCLEITNFVEFTIFRATGKATMKWIKPEERQITSRVFSDAQAPQKKSAWSFLP